MSKITGGGVSNDVLVKINADTTNFVAGVAAAKSSLSSFSTSVNTANNSLGSMLTSMGSAAGSAANQMMLLGGTSTYATQLAKGFINDATPALVDFEKNLSGVLSLLPEARDAYAETSAAVVEMANNISKASVYSANETLGGMYTLGQAGVELKDMYTDLTAISALATGQQADLGTTIDTVMGILNAYGTDVVNVTDVTNMMAAATTSSLTTMDDLTNGMKYLTPVMSAAAVSIKEATAAWTLLNDIGYTGENSGRIMRDMMNDMLNPTAEATGIFAKYNIELYNNSDVLAGLQSVYDTAIGLENSLTDAKKSATMALREQKDVSENLGISIREISAQISKLKDEESEKLEFKALNTEKEKYQGLKDTAQEYYDQLKEAAESRKEQLDEESAKIDDYGLQLKQLQLDLSEAKKRARSSENSEIKELQADKATLQQKKQNALEEYQTKKQYASRSKDLALEIRRTEVQIAAEKNSGFTGDSYVIRELNEKKESLQLQKIAADQQTNNAKDQYDVAKQYSVQISGINADIASAKVKAAATSGENDPAVIALQAQIAALKQQKLDAQKQLAADKKDYKEQLKQVDDQKDAVDGYGKLVTKIDKEITKQKKEITAEYDVQLDALNAQKDALNDQKLAADKVYQSMSDGVQAYTDKITAAKEATAAAREELSAFTPEGLKGTDQNKIQTMLKAFSESDMKESDYFAVFGKNSGAAMMKMVEQYKKGLLAGRIDELTAGETVQVKDGNGNAVFNEDGTPMIGEAKQQEYLQKNSTWGKFKSATNAKENSEANALQPIKGDLNDVLDKMVATAPKYQEALTSVYEGAIKATDSLVDTTNVALDSFNKLDNATKVTATTAMGLVAAYGMVAAPLLFVSGIALKAVADLAYALGSVLTPAAATSAVALNGVTAATGELGVVSQAVAGETGVVGVTKTGKDLKNSDPKQIAKDKKTGRYLADVGLTAEDLAYTAAITNSGPITDDLTHKASGIKHKDEWNKHLAVLRDAENAQMYSVFDPTSDDIKHKVSGITVKDNAKMSQYKRSAASALADGVMLTSYLDKPLVRPTMYNGLPGYNDYNQKLNRNRDSQNANFARNNPSGPQYSAITREITELSKAEKTATQNLDPFVDLLTVGTSRQKGFAEAIKVSKMPVNEISAAINAASNKTAAHNAALGLASLATSKNTKEIGLATKGFFAAEDALIAGKSGGLLNGIKNLIPTALMAGGAFGGEAGLVGGVMASVSSLGIVSTTIGLLANPLTWLVAAIIGLAAIWFTNFDNIQEKSQGVIDYIGEKFGSLIENFWNTIDGIMSGLEGMWNGITEIVSGIIDGDFEKVLQGTADLAGGILTILWSMVEGSVTAVWDIIAGIGGVIYDGAGAIYQAAVYTFSHIPKALAGILQGCMDMLIDGGSWVLNLLGFNITEEQGNAAKQKIAGIMDNVITSSSALFKSVGLGGLAQTDGQTLSEQQALETQKDRNRAADKLAETIEKQNEKTKEATSANAGLTTAKKNLAEIEKAQKKEIDAVTLKQSKEHLITKAQAEVEKKAIKDKYATQITAANNAITKAQSEVDAEKKKTTAVKNGETATLDAATSSTSAAARVKKMTELGTTALDNQKTAVVDLGDGYTTSGTQGETALDRVKAKSQEASNGIVVDSNNASVGINGTTGSVNTLNQSIVNTATTAASPLPFPVLNGEYWVNTTNQLNMTMGQIQSIQAATGQAVSGMITYAAAKDTTPFASANAWGEQVKSMWVDSANVASSYIRTASGTTYGAATGATATPRALSSVAVENGGTAASTNPTSTGTTHSGAGTIEPYPTSTSQSWTAVGSLGLKKGLETLFFGAIPIGTAAGNSIGNAVATGISDHLIPHSPVKKGPLREMASAGQKLMEQLASGMTDDATRKVYAMAGDMMNTLDSVIAKNMAVRQAFAMTSMTATDSNMALSQNQTYGDYNLTIQINAPAINVRNDSDLKSLATELAPLINKKMKPWGASV